MKRSDILFYGVLTALIMLRVIPFGFVYFPYLDDYNAYGSFYYQMAEGKTPLSLYMDYGMYTARPLAGLMDVFVLAPLWNHLWVALLGLAIMFAATLPLMEKVFKSIGLPWGRLAASVFALYPLLDESIYWVNAATRIVPGFFLLFLSAYFLCKYIEKASDQPQTSEQTSQSPEKHIKQYIIIAAAVGILSLGFYEQTVSFGFILLVLIIFKHKKNKWAWYLWPLGYMGVFAVYYAIFLQAGRMASRASVAGAGLIGQVASTFNIIFRQLVLSQGYSIYSIISTDFIRIVTEPGKFILPFAISFVLSGVLILYILRALYEKYDDTANPGDVAKTSSQTKAKAVYIIVSALCLFIASFGPFFILSGSFLKMRNIFFCIPVFAILVQWVWESPPKGLWWFIRIGALGSFAGVFLLFFIFNVNAYRINHDADRHIASQILDRHPNDGYRRAWLFGAKYQHAPHGAVHLESSTLSDWALAGILNTLSMEKGGQIYSESLPDGGYFMSPLVEGWPYEMDIDPARDLFLAITDDMAVIELYMEGLNLFATDTGLYYGELVAEGDIYVFRRS